MIDGRFGNAAGTARAGVDSVLLIGGARELERDILRREQQRLDLTRMERHERVEGTGSFVMCRDPLCADGHVISGAHWTDPISHLHLHPDCYDRMCLSVGGHVTDGSAVHASLSEHVGSVAADSKFSKAAIRDAMDTH